MPDVVEASVVRRRVLLGAALVLVVCAAWSIRHVHALAALAEGGGSRFSAVYTLSFGALVVSVVLCAMDRPRVVKSPRAQQLLDASYVVVPVPVYNEDPTILGRCLWSLLRQTRLPNMIYVVDDGTDGTQVDLGHYHRLALWLEQEGARLGIDVRWERTPNGGKRHAQACAFGSTPFADVYVTVDSDSILAPNAIQELLAPFADPKVKSVAGIVLAANHKRALRTGLDALPAGSRWRDRVRLVRANAVANLVCRLTDLWFVTGQLVDRSAMSAVRSVLVNSGPLAAYRGRLIRERLDDYLSETFFGRPVRFSDDSMLTLYAKLEGDTVQQPSAFAFAAMPETVSHHLRQFVRWMRGSFIRSWWRARYLPITSYAYWAHALRWVQVALSTIVFGYLFLFSPVVHGTGFLYLFAIPLLLGYAQALRYLVVTRSDDTLRSQLLTFALAPVCSLWTFTVLRAVRWYAVATCLRTGWGTRQQVEVSLSPTPGGDSLGVAA